MKIKFLTVVTVICVTVVASGFRFIQPKPWAAPADKAKAANPVKNDAASQAAGKTLWSTHCASCHGKTGLGDGSKAAQLKTQPSDFSKPAFQGQTDGSLFYKVAEGREDMPSFKKKLPDADDIWSLVNFMRSLKK